MGNKKTMSTKKMVMGAVLTAIVIVLQTVASVLAIFNVFPPALVLVPIVIGAATCGTLVAGWLGLVFSVVVLLIDPTVVPFMGINPIATIFLVILKGTLAALAAGAAYKFFSKRCKTIVAVMLTAIICPIVNTGIFVAGYFVFFYEGIVGNYSSLFAFTVEGLIGINFIFELILNIVLSPIVVRLLDIRKKQA